MAEVSISYTFVGPDGSRAVVGNNDAAQADPDFVGFLDAENGITGLLDGADVRESASDLVEADGGSHGPFFEGRRSGTVQGIFFPVEDMAVVNAKREKLLRATRALRGDTVMRWTPSGSSLERELRVRRQQRPGFGGRRPKTFQIALVSADPHVVSASEASLIITPGAAAGELGVQDPVTDPVTSELNVAGQQFVVNQGTVATWPRFRIDGPITNPELLNETTGQRVRLVYDLPAGSFLDVIPKFGQVLLGGTADRYGSVDFAATDWWRLEPSSNDVRLLAAAYSTGAQVTVTWRHAWET